MKSWQQRAFEADNDPPILSAQSDVVDQWVLVPREHLRTIQSWGGDIDETDAIMMCASILADARMLGRA